MKYYKLTDQNMKTYGETKWKIGEREALPTVKNPKLCSGDVFHAYTNANLALLLNPIHANFASPRLFEVAGEVCVWDLDKVGMFEQTLTREVGLPSWYSNNETYKKVAVAFAVLCAESVLKYYEQRNPKDSRPRKAIEAAKKFLKSDSRSAADVAARAADVAARAAYVAARAADAAARAADAAYAAARAADAAYVAAYVAADAVYVARAARAADAAARAADAADAAAEIDFGKLADKAVKMVEEG